MLAAKAAHLLTFTECMLGVGGKLTPKGGAPRGAVGGAPWRHGHDRNNALKPSGRSQIRPPGKRTTDSTSMLLQTEGSVPGAERVGKGEEAFSKFEHAAEAEATESKGGGRKEDAEGRKVCSTRAESEAEG